MAIKVINKIEDLSTDTMRKMAQDQYEYADTVNVRILSETPEGFLKRMPALHKKEKGRIVHDTSAWIVIFLKKGGAVNTYAMGEEVTISKSGKRKIVFVGESIGGALLRHLHHYIGEIRCVLVIWGSESRLRGSDKKRKIVVDAEVQLLSVFLQQRGSYRPKHS